MVRAKNAPNPSQAPSVDILLQKPREGTDCSTVGISSYHLYLCWMAGKENYVLWLVKDGEICIRTSNCREICTVVNVHRVIQIVL